MKPIWIRDADSATDAAVGLLGAVLAIAAVISWGFGHELTGSWLIAAAIACAGGVLLLMYRKAASERDFFLTELSLPDTDAAGAQPVLH